MEKNTGNLFVVLLGAFFLIAGQGYGIAAEQAAEAKKAPVYISSIKPVPESSPYLRDKDPEGNPLQLGGVRFKKGICVTANSEVIYKISGKHATFKAVVGPGDAYLEYQGHLTFSVYGDGKKLYESKPLAVKQKEEIDISVAEMGHLVLRVSSDGLPSQYAIWGDAALY